MTAARNYAGWCWSRQQVEALAQIEDWHQIRSQPFFYLDGFAGTGKSSLAQEVARRAGGRVVFAAFTGKAAAVLRAKGCEGATTIDSLIYQPKIEISCVADPPCKMPPCGQRCKYLREQFVGRTLNDQSALIGAKLCIVDEVSMVGAQMWRDLLSFSVPVLVLGDSAQLPSIGDTEFFTSREPDFQLTEIHRQEAGSPVIRLATRARQGLALKCGRYGNSAVLDRLPSRNELLRHDQIIVGTHRRRQFINALIRRELGFRGPIPQPGERVVCSKNCRAKGLYNGTSWIVREAAPLDDGFLEMTVADDDGRTVDVVAPEEGFSSYSGNGADLPGQPFIFGYALTAHKAQGSEWPSVLIFDDSHVFDEPRRWLYTAVSRAAQRVTIVP